MIGTAINLYLDGMMGWTKLTRKEQLWVWINRPAFCPAEAALTFMGE